METIKNKRDREDIIVDIEKLEEELACLEEDESLKGLRKEMRKTAKMIKMMQEEYEAEGLDKELAIEMTKISMQNYRH